MFNLHARRSQVSKINVQANQRNVSRQLTLTLIGIVITCVACSETGFTAETKAPTKAKKTMVSAEQAKGMAVSRDSKVIPVGENVAVSFAGQTQIQSAASEAETWVVTDDEVTRIKLNEAAGWPQTKWTMVDARGNTSASRGHRTYVSEIGLLIGRSNLDGNDGGVWLASDKNPGKAIPIFRPSDLGTQSRLSVTSFKIGSQAYIGMAYGSSDGKKKFIRIPIDKQKPEQIDVSRKEEVSFGSLNAEFSGLSNVGSLAAYGSFTDQKNKSFFLAGLRQGLWGVNVQTMTELGAANVPNAEIEGRKLCNFTMQTKNSRSYAVAGDLNGNILSATSAYTFAHDPVNNVVLGGSGDRLTLAKQECVTAGGPTCTQAAKQCFEFDLQSAGAIGPISAVGDGRIVGIARSNGKDGDSQVFVMSVVDKDDLTKGISAQKIADIRGDAYMYNDFTGLTLYAPDQVRIIDFKTLKGFQPGKPVRAVAVGWQPSSKNVEDLRGLKVEISCYKSGGPKGPFVDYSKELKSSASLFVVSNKDCGGLVDTLEVKVSSDGTTNNFSRLSLFEMRGAQ